MQWTQKYYNIYFFLLGSQGGSWIRGMGWKRGDELGGF